MPRIIQDSDDEDDVAIDAVIAAAIVSPAKAAELTAAVDVKVSAPAVEPQALQTPHLRGTSSSEKIRRDIEIAHKSLWDPTPSLTASDQRRQRAVDDSDVRHSTSVIGTPDSHHRNLKRTRTAGAIIKTYSSKKDRPRANQKFDALKDNDASDDVWDVPSSARSQRQEGGSSSRPETHDDTKVPGKASQISPQPKRRKIARFSQETVAELTSQTFLTPAPEDSGAAEATIIKPFHEVGAQSGISSSIGDSFLKHNPTVLFPEASSGITSGATQTQATSKTVGTQISTGANDVEKLENVERRLSAAELVRPVDAAIMHMDDNGAASRGALAHAHQFERSPREEQDVVVNIATSKVTIASTEISEDPSKKRRRTSSDAAPAIENGSEVERHEKITDTREHIEGEEPVLRKTRAKKQKTAEMDIAEINADELGIGIPKELYKPRPSRSRGFQFAEDAPIDLAVSPTKGLKGKLKRRKTMGGISTSSKKLREMGFRSSQVEEALAATEGNLNEAVEWLAGRPDLESASQRVSADPQKKSSHVGTTDLSAITEEPEDIAISEVELPERVKEVAAAKSKRGRPKKQQPVATHEEGYREAVAGEIEPLKDTVEPEVEEPPVATQKKARGRPPRKSSKRVVTEEEVPDSAVQSAVKEASRTHPTPLPHDADLALTDIDLNVSKSASLFKAVPSTDVVSESTPVPSSPKGATENSVTSSTKLTPEKSTPARSGIGHSPIKKDRIPLRVGLNRRMRIEPLLRIIRK